MALEVVSYNAASTMARQVGLGGCGCGTGGARYGLADATSAPPALPADDSGWRWLALALGAGAFVWAFKG